MGFHEVLFPTNISYGSRGGPGFSTSVIELDSGRIEAVARWSQARRIYDVSYGIRTWDDLWNVVGFATARDGPANGFRYKDFLDYATTANGRTPPTGGATVGVTALDVTLGTGDGSKKTFQLIRQYTSGAQVKTRTIRKPVSGTVLVAVNDVQQVSPGWTYPWSVNTTTGLITFTTAPAVGLSVKAGCDYDVPVRFDPSIDGGLQAALESFDSGDMPAIKLIEELDPSPVDDEFYYGGSYSASFSVNIEISFVNGRVQTLNPTAGGLSATLPEKAALPLGGPYLYLVNLSGTNSVTIKDFDGSTAFSLGANKTASLFLGLDTGSLRKWYGHGE